MVRIAVFIDFHGRDRSFLLEGIGDFLERNSEVDIHRKGPFARLSFDEFLDAEADARICWLSDSTAIEALERTGELSLNLCSNRACGTALQRVRFDTHEIIEWGQGLTFDIRNLRIRCATAAERRPPMRSPISRRLQPASACSRAIASAMLTSPWR